MTLLGCFLLGLPVAFVAIGFLAEPRPLGRLLVEAVAADLLFLVVPLAGLILLFP